MRFARGIPGKMIRGEVKVLRIVFLSIPRGIRTSVLPARVFDIAAEIGAGGRRIIEREASAEGS